MESTKRPVPCKPWTPTVEMCRCRRRDCAAVRGAQMFKDAEKGNREVNHVDRRCGNRCHARNGVPVLHHMMTDGVKNAEKEGEIDVKDIAELIAEAADLL